MPIYRSYPKEHEDTENGRKLYPSVCNFIHTGSIPRIPPAFWFLLAGLPLI